MEPPPPAARAQDDPEASARAAGVPRSLPVPRLFAGVPTLRSSPATPPPDEPSRADVRLAQALRRASRAAAALVLLGGGTALLGWLLDLRSLRAVGPGDVGMNPLAALLFVLTGSGLLLDGHGRSGRLVRVAGAACALAIALCGFLVLLRSLAGWHVGVDEWLFRDAVRRSQPPARMAGDAALSFLLLGLALLTREVRGRRGGRPAHWLLLPTALSALLVVIAHLYGAAGRTPFDLPLPMALSTALLFLAACFALLGARPDEGVTALFVSDSGGGALTRRLLPALLLGPLVLGALINVGIRFGGYGPTAGLALLTVATTFLSVLFTLTTAGALHRSDLALRRSEEHFRALIENALDYVIIIDPAGAARYVSPSVERILGYRPEELLGSTPEQLVHPQDVAKIHDANRKVFGYPGEVFRAEFRIRHRNGSWRVFESMARTLRADSGEAGAVVNARDITERSRAEDELARQKAYFEQVLGRLDGGIAVFDPKGRFEYVSPSALIEPHVRRSMIGKTLEEYGRAKNLPPAVIAPRRQSLEQAIRTRSPSQYEHEATRADGSTWQVLHQIVPITNEAGELVRLVEFSVDITDRKAAEIALQAAKEEAERANRAKSEFLSRMSHELRTPMNAILGFAQVLDRKGPRPDERRYLEHIQKGGEHLLGLINEVLDLSRIESGRVALSIEPVGVKAVIREAMDLVRPKDSDAELRFEDAERPEVFALADRQRLSQVLINLLSNAVKYNRAGGQVRISTRASWPGVTIRVQDCGRGIPRERLDQLFTPFARLGAEQTETEGTGLGLALSRRLAEAMGGELVLESTGPEGSTFRLDLRLGADPRSAPPPARGPLEGGAGEASTAGTILYIEDNLTNLSLVETILESKPNWRTISALRGEAGLELAREKRPGLILLDVHLPDLSGDEVLERLRADPRTADIPVVIVSADATDAARARLRAAGADGYLTKPLDLDQFVATVERFLSDHAGPRPRG